MRRILAELPESVRKSAPDYANIRRQLLAQSASEAVAPPPARDKATGKQQNITITAASTLTKDEVERMMREAEAHAAEDALRKQEIGVPDENSLTELASRFGIKVIYVTANPAQIGTASVAALGVVTKPFRAQSIAQTVRLAATEALQPDIDVIKAGPLPPGWVDQRDTCAANAGDLAGLMDAASYAAHVDAEAH